MSYFLFIEEQATRVLRTNKTQQTKQRTQQMTKMIFHLTFSLAAAAFLSSPSSVSASNMEEKAIRVWNVDTPGGMCLSDSDCHTKIRHAYPPESHAESEPERLRLTEPGLCDCYAASDRFTFVETEGQKNFRIARCSADACD